MADTEATAAVESPPQGIDATLDKVLDDAFNQSEELNEAPPAKEGEEQISEEASDGKEDASTEGEKTPEEEPLEAPAFWPSAEREAFGKLPREQQEFLLNRHNTLTAEYTRKTQEVAQLRREHTGIEDALERHRQRLDLEGIDPGALLDRVLSFQAAFERDPRAAISWLANTAGLSLSQLAQMEQSQSPNRADPAIQQLLTKVSALEQAQREQLEAQRAQAQQAEQQSLEEAVNVFTAAKDAAGALKYPHVAEVIDDMVPFVEHLAANNPSMPLSQVLETAYIKACRASDSVSKKVQEQERLAKAKAAKMAGSSVAQGPGGSHATKAKPRSLDEALDLAMGQTR